MNATFMLTSHRETTTTRDISQQLTVATIVKTSFTFFLFLLLPFRVLFIRVFYATRALSSRDCKENSRAQVVGGIHRAKGLKDDRYIYICRERDREKSCYVCKGEREKRKSFKDSARDREKTVYQLFC